MAWLNSTPGSGERAASPTVFEQQREELVREIAVVSIMPAPSSTFYTNSREIEHKLICNLQQGMEQVLQNINRLNRNLESIITVRIIYPCSITLSTSFANDIQVGNEFSSVEALWSQFENFMGRPEEELEEAAQGKRTVSGESAGQGNAGTQHEGEGDSMASQ